MGNKLIRIAVTGPESTGKTTLVEQLSVFFKVDGVPEFAREFLLKQGGSYNQGDLFTIAEGQRNAIQMAVSSAHAIVITDTEMTILKVWSEFKFGSIDERIQAFWKEEKWDLVFLTGTDIPWEFDELREHPEQREHLLELYRDLLKQRGDNVVELWGDSTKRFDKAKMEIEKFLSDRSL